MRPSKGHSQTGDHIVRDKPGHGKNAIEEGALTHWRPYVRDKSGHRRGAFEGIALTGWRPHGEEQVRRQNECDRVREKGALTHWRPHHKGQVRAPKEYDQASGTHVLETA